MIDRLELREVITRRLESAKARNRSYSLRAMSKRLDVSPAELSEFMRGIRSISEPMAQKIVAALELNSAEHERVVQRGQGILKGQKSVESTILSTEEYLQISQWYYFAILSISETVDFKSDASWIAQRLNICEQDAQTAIQKMLHLGMLKVDENGQFTATGKSFATAEGQPGDALRKAHKTNFKLAAENLDFGRVEDRDFRAVTICIDPARLPEARKVLQDFHRRFASFLDQGPKTEVYKFCMQLFPITTRTSSAAPVRSGLLKVAVAMILTAASGSLYADPHFENGGGGAMVCKTDNEQPTYRMLDLWEAERIDGIHIKELSGDNSEENAERIAQEILEKTFSEREILEIFKWSVGMNRALADSSQTLPPGIIIQPPLDGGNGFGDPNCTLRGVALYNPITNKLHVDRDLYKHFNLQDRVALRLHEIIYYAYRRWHNVESSSGVRRFVGCLLADSPCPGMNPMEGITSPPYSMLRCVSYESQSGYEGEKPEVVFHVVNDAELRLQFLTLNGHTVPTKTIFKHLISYNFHHDIAVKVEGKNYFPISWFSLGGTTVPILSASAGQSLTATFSTISSHGHTILTINGLPIACREE